MRLHTFSLVVLILVLALLPVSARADSIVLGTADPYAVLAKTDITNPTTFAATVITGDMGISPATSAACTGFVLATGCTGTAGPGVVASGYATNFGNAPAAKAVLDAQTAYNDLAATPTTTPSTTFDITGQCLGSAVGCLNDLGPGVYNSTTLVIIDGALTLHGDGSANDLWIFKTAADVGLTTDSGSSVLVDNTGALAGVYFEVGTKATLGDVSTIEGNILAGTAVIFDPGAQVTCGRAFAQSEVTFAGNKPAAGDGTPNLVDNSGCSAISSTGFNGGTIVSGTVVPSSLVVAPEPGTFALLSSGLLAMVFLAFRKSRGSSLTR